MGRIPPEVLLINVLVNDEFTVEGPKGFLNQEPLY